MVSERSGPNSIQPLPDMIFTFDVQGGPKK